MKAINNIKLNQSKSQSKIKVIKECQSKNEHKLVIPVNLKQI